MQKLHFFAATAVLLGTTACPTIDPFDDLGTDTSFTTADEADESSTDAGTEAGTTDAETTTAGTTDATSTTDESTDGGCGSFGCDCVDSSTCDPGLECNEGICGQPQADTTEDTTDSTDTGGGDPWDPAMCEAPSQALGVGDLEGNFCSAPCQGSMDMSCPAGPEGTFAQCALTTMGETEPTFCALICMVAQDTCSPGSSCKDLMDAMNPGLGLCTYP